MTKILSMEGVEIVQKNYQQVLIRGDGKDQFKQIINKQISLLPPIDQWILLYTKEIDYNKVLKFVADINSNDEILASDYSYGQVYFEITGKNKNIFLNQLTNFDLRLKRFPEFTMAQTLVARIDCYIYHLKDKYILTCNKSYEKYFKDRLVDLANLN
jgi:heterotetrameric sarcosine oxidase gamma subunit